jgi:hypothetical protein
LNHPAHRAEPEVRINDAQRMDGSDALEPGLGHGVTCMRRYAMSDTERKNPGDEDVPGTKQTGENICPTCHGSGSIGQKPCPDCGGSGRVTVIVGDA